MRLGSRPPRVSLRPGSDEAQAQAQAQHCTAPQTMHAALSGLWPLVSEVCESEKDGCLELALPWDWSCVACRTTSSALIRTRS